MDKKNIMIIGVAAVVIAVCAFATYLHYADDGGDDVAYEMRDPVLGDSITSLMIVTYENGGSVNSHVTRTLVGIMDDGTQIVHSVIDRDYDLYSAEPLWIEDDLEGCELLGTETVNSPLYGTVECDVYLNQGGVEIMVRTGTDDYVMERLTVDGITQELILVWTTLFEDPVEAEGAVSVEKDDVRVGDLYSYVDTFHGDDGNETTYTKISRVMSVDGDDLVVLYTMADGRSETVETTKGEFLDHLYFDPSEGDGRFIVDSWSYGPVICTMIIEEIEGATVYRMVGVEDGIEYATRTVYADGYENGQLLYSTFITGEGWYGSGELREEAAGDYYSALIVYGRGDDLRSYLLEMTVVSSIGGEAVVTMEVDGADAGIRDRIMDHQGGDYGEMDTEVISTPYGDMECAVMVTEREVGEHLVTVTQWLAPYGSGYMEMKAEYRYEDGYTITQYVNVYTPMEYHPLTDDGPLVYEKVEVGDVVRFLLEQDGTIELVTTTVTGIDGDDVTIETVIADEEPNTDTVSTDEYYGFDMENYELVGSAYRETQYGILLMDAYSKTVDGTTTMTYAWEGVPLIQEVIVDGEVLMSIELLDAPYVY